MIFKPSSLHKLFFTYICPRFYGGAPATPSNTTSTSTVNQSPWQNPVYQALMLGTASQPGPATSMLNASRDQMAQWNAINSNGLDPATQASLGAWNPNVAGSTAAYTNNLDAATGRYIPTVNPDAVANRNSPIEQGAAQGGIMGLKGYASGGTSIADLTKKAEEYKKIVDSGQMLTSAQNTLLSNYNTYKSQIDAGIVDLDASGNPIPNIPQGATKAQTDAANAAFTEATGSQPTTGKAPYSLTDTLKQVAYFDPTTGQSTNADFLAIQKKARELGTPEQYAQGTDAYNQALAATNALKNYKPSDIAALQAQTAGASATGYDATNMAAPSNIGAQQANVAGVDTTGYQASNMNAPSNIGAQQANVSTMQGAGPVGANQLNQYQMQGPGSVNAPTAGTNQMAGPQSWLDQGTAASYMSPYQQNVTDIQKREADRAYRQQGNELNAQAVKSGAFGGSRQAIQQSEAARNQNMLLNDIQAKGQQEAYASGMGQFNAAQGQQMQAGQANLGASQQTTLANQAAQIQAMMANQGMDYNTAVQNLQAKMGIQNTQAGQDLQAALANQGVQQQTQSTNMAATNQAQNAFVQQALQAAQANQGAQLTAAQQNQIAQNAAAQYTATNQQQGNLATQQATNTAQNAFVQQALQAAQANQGAQLTAAQQNQIAQNAASQYNASNQQNVNLATQGAQNTANQQYASQNLAAQQANQSAGLQANQQNLGAAQQLGSLGQGLAGIGTAQNAAQLANLGAQGQVAQAEQNLGQSYLDAQSSNATSWLNAPTAINAGAANVLNAQPVSGGTTSTVGTTAPSHWARGGLIKNGKVNKGSKK